MNFHAFFTFRFLDFQNLNNQLKKIQIDFINLIFLLTFTASLKVSFQINFWKTLIITYRRSQYQHHILCLIFLKIHENESWEKHKTFSIVFKDLKMRAKVAIKTSNSTTFLWKLRQVFYILFYYWSIWRGLM